LKFRIFFFVFLLCIILLGWGALHLGDYLSAPAQIPRKVDLIVVLGGDSGARSLTGAKLYRDGFAPYVLLTGLDEGEKETLPFYLHWRSQVLIAKGVSQDSLLVDTKSMNSWQEAQNTLELMKQNKWQGVLVVSDSPHMRRLDWVWGNTFDGSGKEYLLVEAKPYWWQPESWWSDERSAKFVINELIKLVYYQIKYQL